MNKKVSLKNIILPISIFLYLPFSLFVIIIIWGSFIDMRKMSRWGHTFSLQLIMPDVIITIAWILITYVLARNSIKECKRDKSFIIMCFIPIVMFVCLYLSAYLVRYFF